MIRDDPLSEIFVGDNRANEFTGTAGFDLFIGRGGADSFFGLEGPDVAFGERGNDILVMDDGLNVAFGGPGNDRVDALGGFGGSELHGDSGNDELIGSFSNDVISGGPGRDRLDSQEGNDVLTGGGGRDIFAFEGDLRFAVRGIGDDVITDFRPNVDRIEIDAFFTPGLTGFADVIANITDAPAGAVLTVPDPGQPVNEGTITFVGVETADLDAADFLFV